ncbi:hypothetical protein JYU34_005663 [Plutella xylostella]|uniref:Dynein regulatory complex subunit 2 n=1 Tax=Plutella xylostella TaxID=51655 RepID=A0ABQ7QTS6_PLUXY|nr:hypothetical protein JYU34_005663 [Plutella xylostella]
MPKKPKVNKLARMSDEERARYLQHRADLEEEARRRKRELIARFIKNKLDKEEAFSRKNTAKLNQMWRYVLRKIKCKQMAREIEGMMSTFNYLMERKQRLITALMSSLGDSDDQHRRAFQAHTETISDFLGIGSQRLDKLHEEYERQKNILLESWDHQEMDLNDHQHEAEFKLKLITYVQDRDFQQYRRTTDQERATDKNDARIEHEEQMRRLLAPAEQLIEACWSRLRGVYSGFLQQHQPVAAHYQLLVEKDDFYQRDIARNERQIQRATKLLLTLQKQYHRTVTASSVKLQRLVARKEELSRRYWQLKRDCKSAGSRGDNRLVVLVEASQGVVERMEGLKKKLEKIQQLAEICSKFEKEEDREVMGQSDDDNGGVVLYDHLDDAMAKECTEYSKMDKFMLKMNHVKVQALCLKAEKTKLSKENIQLKHYIKKYLTELALKNEKDRPSTVKVQSGINKAEMPKILRPVTCIEGAVCNAVMHEKRMKILEKKNLEFGGIRAYPRMQNWMHS